MENPYRLQYGTPTWVGDIRGSGEDEEVLICGLGGMRVGSMWRKATQEYRSTEEYRKCAGGMHWDFLRGWVKNEPGRVHLDPFEFLKEMCGKGCA